MDKIAFIFPGQGAQYIGMGKDFYDHIPTARDVYHLAGKATGIDMKALCFAENDNLNITEYTQIAMLATEVAILKALEERDIKPDVCAGLSLGEYGALVAAGVLNTEDAFRVIRQRGIFMQEAVPVGGAMAAVLGMEAEMILKAFEETDGIVSIANYNCPGQIVITGEKTAVEAAGERLKEAGAKRVIMLNVSGPFHSEMLADAGKQLGEVLKDIKINDFKIPYVSNVTAEYVADSASVKSLLVKQVSACVKWQQSVECMIENGITIFIEIGPGKTLSGFIRKINKEIKVLNIDKLEDLEKAVSEIKGER